MDVKENDRLQSYYWNLKFLNEIVIKNKILIPQV
jgi:hypothetical protein